MIHSNLTINKKGHLNFAGKDVVEMAKGYGTPVMLLDEQGIRDKCREYKVAAEKHLGEDSNIAYASKALSFVGLNKILREEGMSVDVASAGEICTARVAGFPMERVYFHGNYKTDMEINYALKAKVGYFMVDNPEELKYLNYVAGLNKIKQKVFLRLTPGVSPDTIKQVITGATDSKFGVPIQTGAAEQFVKDALKMKNLELCGYHCHIGSQIFDAEPYKDAVIKMMLFSRKIKNKYKFEAPEIVLGGGFGVRYVESQPSNFNYEKAIETIGSTVRHVAMACSMKVPKIGLEPGRSIVASNGLTLYTVGCVKEIPGVKNYVITDGSMADNPRFALYQSPYTVKLANRMNEKENFNTTIAGRACESGDIIQENVNVPKPRRGDLLAVCCTGAYNYSMASNYNRIQRPPIVSIDKDGNEELQVKREPLTDIVSLDIF